MDDDITTNLKPKTKSAFIRVISAVVVSFLLFVSSAILLLLLSPLIETIFPSYTAGFEYFVLFLTVWVLLLSSQYKKRLLQLSAIGCVAMLVISIAYRLYSSSDSIAPIIASVDTEAASESTSSSSETYEINVDSSQDDNASNTQETAPAQAPSPVTSSSANPSPAEFIRLLGNAMDMEDLTNKLNIAFEGSDDLWNRSLPQSLLNAPINLVQGNRGIDRFSMAYITEDQDVVLKIAANTNLTDDLIMSGAYRDIRAVVEGVARSDVEYKSIIVIVTFELLDIYGNSSENPIVGAAFVRQEVEKINWAAIRTENLMRIASSVRLYQQN